MENIKGTTLYRCKRCFVVLALTDEELEYGAQRTGGVSDVCQHLELQVVNFSEE